MKTLIIYDNAGVIYYRASGDVKSESYIHYNWFAFG